MIDKNCLKSMNTKCEKDRDNRHYWERRGIVNYESIPTLSTIWQCTQCDLCAEEDLEFVPQEKHDA